MLKRKENVAARVQAETGDRAATPVAARMEETGEGERARPSPFAAAVQAPFFETATLRRQLDEIGQAVVQQDKVLIVEGERGSGRTTLLRELCARRAAALHVCRIEAPIPLGEKHVLERLGRALCGETLDARDLLVRLIERGRRSPFTLIVVDDADNLSAFAIKALFTLKRGVSQAGGRIGLLLAARPLTVESIFSAPSFAELHANWLTSVALEPFTEEETADYLRHRLEAAGRASEVTFSGAQVRAIQRAANGLPGYINRLAEEALNGGRLRRYRTESQERRARQLKRRSLAAGGAGLLLLVLLYTFYAALIKPSALEREIARAERSFDADTGLAAAMPDAAEIASESGAESEAAAPPAETIGDRAPAAAAPAPKVETAPRPEPVPQHRQDAAPMPVALTAPPPTVPAAAETEAKIAPPVQPPPASLEEQTSPAAEAKPPASVAPEQMQPEPVAAAAPEPPSAAAPEPPVKLRGKAWLMAQDPDRYTIQLAGTPERVKAQEFIDKHPLSGEVTAVRTARNGRIRYVVLYNSYAGLGAAQQELAALPPEVQKNGPFVRRLSSIQSIATDD